MADGEVYLCRTRVEAPAAEVFRWHARPGALERLTPPWTRIEVLERTGGGEDGSRAVLRVRLGPLGLRWVAERRDAIEGRQFRDVQVEGPFARWAHTHSFEPDGPASCIVEDRVDYALPLGALGRLLGGRRLARRLLDRLFAYRHRILADDLRTHSRYAAAGPLTIAVTGASGLVGSALVAFLTTGGHRVLRLVRRAGARPVGPDQSVVAWDPEAGVVEAEGLEGADAVVHLAGENVAALRWTRTKKARIRDSRVRGTRVLSEALARLARPPRVLVTASAIGYYGSRGAEVLEEGSGPGAGFLAEVCREWEAATAAAAAQGIRVVRLRIGIVLDARGGVLARLLPPFRLGLGGPVGSGRQWVSWISIDDLLGVILHALATDILDGPVNAVAPEPVTNRDLSRTLGRVLARPALLPLPAGPLRLALGEMADETVLSSARVTPARLVATGYTYRDPSLEGALLHQLGRPIPPAAT